MHSLFNISASQEMNFVLFAALTSHFLLCVPRMLRSPLDQYFLLGVMLATLVCTSAAESDSGTLRWNKAHGLWGKRSLFKEADNNEQKRPGDAPMEIEWAQRYVPPSPEFLDWEKRSQWQLANGLWGRRR